MDSSVLIGIVTVGGTVAAQIIGVSYIAGKFAQQLEQHDAWMRETDDVLDAHAEKLDIHGNRISRLETKAGL